MAPPLIDNVQQLARWPGVLLAGVSWAALMWRHRRPRTTVLVTTLGAMAMAGLGYLLTVLLLGPLMIALYSLALRTDRRTANAFAFTGIALLIGTTLIFDPYDEPLSLKLLGPAAWLLLPTALGTMARLRGAYLEAVQARAEHAERTREEEARRRVAEERMRIARDLHDVVAHHLVLANLQAGAVARMLPGRPAEAGRITDELTRTTVSALRELKATVGLLRHHTDDADDHARPTPGLDRLPELTDSFEGAGLKVTVTTEGQPRPLSAGADLTAYRIVQEALTNVTKHAADRAAEVRLSYGADRLVLVVSNGGRAGQPADSLVGSGGYGSGGYGLLGMRERARSVGGRIRMGHRPEGGFEVVTELPLPPH
ncbi:MULTISPECIES: histidine kinase [unclassified Streptomyces]|uniref:sensor histidine kinase n=1 Tax=unclassified Streptomyces TaxID=2593676 RepID=UPI0023660631|nr:MULTISPECIES: histidine kinase [unclassified Streptomyces]MDF3142513.1 histidine kinase [Streptomyces sp. T21Q-yed]WDF39775.1 histidine kinase [Streptomyces sp. T12]